MLSKLFDTSVVHKTEIQFLLARSSLPSTAYLVRITPAATSFCIFDLNRPFVSQVQTFLDLDHTYLIPAFFICSAKAAGSLLACWRMLCMTGSWRMAMIYNTQSALCKSFALSDSTHIWVPLYPLRRLILRLPFPSHELCLQSLLLLLLDLPVVGPSLVMLESLSAHIQAFVVFLHCKVGLRFPQICSDEFRVSLDGLVAICYGSRECHQFYQSCCTIRVAARVVWSTLGHLGVCFDSSGPIRFLELLIPKLTRLVCLFGVDVGSFLCNYLGFLGRAEFVENVGSAVLGQGLLVIYDGVSEVS